MRISCRSSVSGSGGNGGGVSVSGGSWSEGDLFLFDDVIFAGDDTVIEGASIGGSDEWVDRVLLTISEIHDESGCLPYYYQVVIAGIQKESQFDGVVDGDLFINGKCCDIQYNDGVIAVCLDNCQT